MAQLEYDTESITDAVIARLDQCQDARFKQLMTSLVRHVHAFAREVEVCFNRLSRVLRVADDQPANDEHDDEADDEQERRRGDVVAHGV